MVTKKAAVDEGIYYPEAIKNKFGKMKVGGTYKNRFPIGAVIHSTDGRPNDGTDSTKNGVDEGLYAYFVIGRTGKVFQNFSLENWGGHSGPTSHPELGTKLSMKLVGIELNSAGKLKKIDDNRYRPYYNEKNPKL